MVNYLNSVGGSTLLRQALPIGGQRGGHGGKSRACGQGMWPYGILQSTGSRKNCSQIQPHWRTIYQEGPQDAAKQPGGPGERGSEGLFPFTLRSRAPLAYGTVLDRESQPILNQSSRASGTRPLARLLCQLGCFSFQLRSAGRVSRAPRAQKRACKCSPKPSCLVLSGSLLLPY